MSAIRDVQWNFRSPKLCEGLGIKDKEEAAIFLNKITQHYHTCQDWILRLNFDQIKYIYIYIYIYGL